MPKLNQILAIEKGTKDRYQGFLTGIYQRLEKSDLLIGISRTYKKNDEDGEQFPPETKRVQLRANEVISSLQDELTDLFDITAAKDFANASATADIVLDDGTVLLTKVPTTYILWLEKRLVDLHTFVSKLPELSQAEDWTFDTAQNCYRSASHDTAKTKKIPRPFVKYEATKEHPAQVDVVSDDKVTGYWTTVNFSGALPATKVAELKDRVQKLQAAVKFAREQANLTEAPKQKIGEKVLGYLFA